jgi:hypothetical protein
MKNPAIAIIAIVAAFAVNAFAQTTVYSSEPGKAAMTETVNITATIVAIDAATRDITLKGPKGNWVVVTAGPEVKNFDQLNVGDKVHMTYVEALVLELKKGGGRPANRIEQKEAIGAAPGAQPAGVVGRKITAITDVTDKNLDKHTVTLRGPQLTVEIRVDDPEQFNRIRKGDQVEATYTQALAMVVEKK